MFSVYVYTLSPIGFEREYEICLYLFLIIAYRITLKKIRMTVESVGLNALQRAMTDEFVVT